MSIIKSFSVGDGDMFYINHNTDNFSIIDCNLEDDRKEEIMNEVSSLGSEKEIMRFISTHPDEDHFHGIEYFDERFKILNFYCTKNEATKADETVSFKHYCQLRDGEHAFYLNKGCTRKWMNQSGEGREGAGINILWPVTDNEEYKAQLQSANNGGNANNISPIIKYSLQDGVVALWFGDLEESFMLKIQDEITLPQADIVFAPHHGRSSGKLPRKWREQINPSIIVIGEADSDMLDYYNGYQTITQNSAGDIVFECVEHKVHIFVSNKNYSKDFQKDPFYGDNEKGHYLGFIETRG